MTIVDTIQIPPIIFSHFRSGARKHGSKQVSLSLPVKVVADYRGACKFPSVLCWDINFLFDQSAELSVYERRVDSEIVKDVIG